MAAQQVIETYYNTLKHLRVAQPFIEDIAEIDAMLVNFDYDEAETLIDYLLTKYEQDFTLIGKHLTGVLIMNKKDVPTKNGADLRNDLIYLKDIEAKGLDENYNLIVDRTPKMNFLAKSTPELILKRIYEKSDDDLKAVYARILEKF